MANKFNPDEPPAFINWRGQNIDTRTLKPVQRSAARAEAADGESAALDQPKADIETVFSIPRDHYQPGYVGFGCRMVFADGLLFFSVGDRGVEDEAQKLETVNGKIHRVRDDLVQLGAGSDPEDPPDPVGEYSAQLQVLVRCARNDGRSDGPGYRIEGYDRRALYESAWATREGPARRCIGDDLALSVHDR